MAKLADALPLGGSAERRLGSNPSVPTNLEEKMVDKMITHDHDAGEIVLLQFPPLPGKKHFHEVKAVILARLEMPHKYVGYDSVAHELIEFGDINVTN